MTAQQAATLTIADIGLKMGRSKKGPWTLATITGSDGHKYKTFNDDLIARAKEAIGASQTVQILFTESAKTFTNEKGEQVPYTDREIQDLVIQKDAPPPAPRPAGPAGQTMPPECWDHKQLLEFQRTASMSALKACAEIMSACIAGQIESYKFDDAMRIVKLEAKALYAAYFKPLEGGSYADDDASAGLKEEAEIVE